MNRLMAFPLLFTLAALGCGSSNQPVAPISKEAEARQDAQQKEADDAENAYQKESGGIQEKGKKPKK